MSPTPGVTVGALLDARPESFGLPCELLAGVAGPRSAHHQSLHSENRVCALAGFHEYLKPGRVLIFGRARSAISKASETAGRLNSLRLALTLDFPCVLITGGFAPPEKSCAKRSA